MTTQPPGRFCWQELATPDPEKALAFYEQLFGWESETRDMGEAGTYHLLELDGKDLGGLYALAGPMSEGVPLQWMGYVKVADIEASASKVAELGGRVIMGPVDIPDVGRMLLFSDPQGAHLCTYQDGEHRGKELDDQANHAFCWSELMTTDTEGAKAFYTGLFGWDVHETDMGPSGTYTMWMQDGEHTGGCMKLPPEAGDAPPHWMHYVNVADVEASQERAVDLGATVVVPVMPIPEVGRFTMIADPTGAHLCLFQGDPKPK